MLAAEVLMLRIRLARRGRRNLNAFAIVAAEQKFRRDGRFVEKIGYYQPLLKDADPFRLHIDKDRFEYWVSQGAQPSDKILQLAYKLGIVDKKPIVSNRPNKSQPKAKALERIAHAQAAQEAAKAAAQAEIEAKKARIEEEKRVAEEKAAEQDAERVNVESDAEVEAEETGSAATQEQIAAEVSTEESSAQ